MAASQLSGVNNSAPRAWVGTCGIGGGGATSAIADVDACGKGTGSEGAGIKTGTPVLLTPAGLSDAGGEPFDPSMPDRTLSGGGPPVSYR